MHIFQPTAVRERVTEITPPVPTEPRGARPALRCGQHAGHLHLPRPFPGGLEWVKAMGEAGFRMIIISNNFKGRVGSFGAVFGLDTLSFALKPCRWGTCGRPSGCG